MTTAQYPSRADADVLASRAKSFHWASRILPDDDIEDVAALYAFCRYADDLADDLPVEDAGPALRRVRAQLRSPRVIRPSDPHEVRGFKRLVAERGLDARPAEHLLDGLLRDTATVAVRDEPELLRYAYEVAGVVGLWMAQLLGATDRRAEPFAIDLGIAMQLTNIARDVREDAVRNRVYLPQSWLGARMAADTILDGSPRLLRRVHRAQRRALDLAATYYRSADRGMAFLPRRARLCILSASRIYEAIGTEIRRAGVDSLRRRCFVNRRGKTWQTVRAWFASREDARVVRAHDDRLHDALIGLPGVGSAA